LSKTILNAVLAYNTKRSAGSWFRVDILPHQPSMTMALENTLAEANKGK
jgi:hypothetical protein